MKAVNHETERLNILVVTPMLPHPPIWGFATRVFQLVQHLAQRHQITLVTYTGAWEAGSVEALQQMGMRVVSLPHEHVRGGPRVAQVKSLFSRHSRHGYQLVGRAMQATIDRLLTTESFDVIQIESTQMSQFRFAGRTPIVIDEHNIEYELLQRMYQGERSLARRLYNFVEFKKFRAEEQRAWQRATACAVTSEREQQILSAAMPGKATMVAPNGVDVEYFQPAGEPIQAGRLVFTGMMRYRPNVDAAVYLVGEILPRILRHRPNASVALVGAEPAKEVQRLASSRVIVTNTVPDVRPYVNEAAVMVVPLRMGSGTRLKVLEALAMAKPLVSTSLGCEGIDVRPGEHLLIADDADDFARSVLELLDDRDRARSLGERGRALVEARYSWTSVAKDFDEFLQAVVQAHRLQQPQGSMELAESSIEPHATDEPIVSREHTRSIQAELVEG